MSWSARVGPIGVVKTIERANDRLELDVVGKDVEYLSLFDWMSVHYLILATVVTKVAGHVLLCQPPEHDVCRPRGKESTNNIGLFTLPSMFMLLSHLSLIYNTFMHILS